MRSAVADRRIEAIAGVPLAQRTTIGRTAIGLDQLPALEGRTMYAVATRTATIRPLSFAEFAVESVNSQTCYLRGMLAGEGAECRPQFPGGGGASATYSFNASAPISANARYAVALVFDPGLASATIYSSAGGLPGQRSGMDVGAGFTAPCVGLTPRDGGDTALYASMYRGAHDAATRIRIMAWLAQRFSLSLSLSLSRSAALPLAHPDGLVLAC